MNNRVVLGLSGGVDSAVAALLLKQAGWQVHALWLDIGLGGEEEARALARSLDLPFSVGDIRAELEEKVISPFCRDYCAGRTPLPCALCNPTVKFPALFRKADEVEADFVATGHYARVLSHVPDGPGLYRARSKNDQSYMLARLPRDWLSRLVFPLGDYDKTEVRALARRAGLTVADKPDSMELCFVPDNDYAAFLERRGQVPPPGALVDRAGKVLGRHGGIHRYTIGQRRGLRLPSDRRLFVTELRPEDNTVVLSDGRDLMADLVWGEDFNALAHIQPGEALAVRLRHSRNETPARFTPQGRGGLLELDAPARAPTPGQMAVLYRGDRVVGSFWITGAHRIEGGSDVQ